METFLFFDTETTGLPKNWKAPVQDISNWPRLVQLAWIICNSERQVIKECQFIIIPDNFIIPSSATAIHGISNETAIRFGRKLSDVLHEFSSDINIVDNLVAHNMSFDENIIGAEFIRANIKSKLFSKDRICTMLISTNYCSLPSSRGYKWPSLSELHFKLFGTIQEESHKALEDVKITFKCFWKLKELNIINYKGVPIVNSLASRKSDAIPPAIKEIENEYHLSLEDNEFINFWNSLSEYWKSLIAKSVVYAKPIIEDSIFGPAIYPSFNPNKKLDANDIALLKSTIVNTKYIYIKNEYGINKKNCESLEPLRYFENLESLTLINDWWSHDSKNYDLNPISSLRKLTYLNFEGTSITDLTALSFLVNITSLKISHTKVSALDSIVNLKKLKYLDFSNTPVSSIEALSNLTSLTELLFENTPVTSLNPISNLLSLEKLSFSCYTIQGLVTNLAPLTSLTKLTKLQMSGQKIRDTSALSELINLSMLVISRTPINDITSLANLTRLEVLWIHETPISSLVPLKKMSELVTLHFNQTFVSDITPLFSLPKLAMGSCDNYLIPLSQLEKLKNHFPNIDIKSINSKKNTGCFSLLLLIMLAFSVLSFF